MERSRAGPAGLGGIASARRRRRQVHADCVVLSVVCIRHHQLPCPLRPLPPCVCPGGGDRTTALTPSGWRLLLQVLAGLRPASRGNRGAGTTRNRLLQVQPAEIQRLPGCGPVLRRAGGVGRLLRLLELASRAETRQKGAGF